MFPNPLTGIGFENETILTRNETETRVLPTLVGSNHHSAFLTTTQLMFDSIYNMGESPFTYKKCLRD